MRCKVQNFDDVMPISDMRDGDIGIITAWEDHEQYAESIVQAYGDGLIQVGKPSGDSWGVKRSDLLGFVCILSPPFTLKFTEC